MIKITFEIETITDALNDWLLTNGEDYRMAGINWEDGRRIYEIIMEDELETMFMMFNPTITDNVKVNLFTEKSPIWLK